MAPYQPAISKTLKVQLDKSFVLIFAVEENNGVVEFVDLKHHDEIYRRK